MYWIKEDKEADTKACVDSGASIFHLISWIFYPVIVKQFVCIYSVVYISSPRPYLMHCVNITKLLRLQTMSSSIVPIWKGLSVLLFTNSYKNWQNVHIL